MLADLAVLCFLDLLKELSVGLGVILAGSINSLCIVRYCLVCVRVFLLLRFGSGLTLRRAVGGCGRYELGSLSLACFGTLRIGSALFRSRGLGSGSCLLGSLGSLALCGSRSLGGLVLIGRRLSRLCGLSLLVCGSLGRRNVNVYHLLASVKVFGLELIGGNGLGLGSCLFGCFLFRLLLLLVSVVLVEYLIEACEIERLSLGSVLLPEFFELLVLLVLGFFIGLAALGYRKQLVPYIVVVYVLLYLVFRYGFYTVLGIVMVKYSVLLVGKLAAHLERFAAYSFKLVVILLRAPCI